ncbi:unnamed protein product, partial [Amoebophrya sp. A120]
GAGAFQRRQQPGERRTGGVGRQPGDRLLATVSQLGAREFPPEKLEHRQRQVLPRDVRFRARDQPGRGCLADGAGDGFQRHVSPHAGGAAEHGIVGHEAGA